GPSSRVLSPVAFDFLNVLLTEVKRRPFRQTTLSSSGVSGTVSPSRNFQSFEGDILEHPLLSDRRVGDDSPRQRSHRCADRPSLSLSPPSWSPPTRWRLPCARVPTPGAPRAATAPGTPSGRTASASAVPADPPEASRSGRPTWVRSPCSGTRATSPW